MAKGREKHQARLDAIGLLGKDLARRADKKCELCEGKGDLRPHDTAPGEEPSLDTIALFCADCRARLEGRDDPAETLRFLEVAIWNEHPPVQRSARALIRRVDADWARAALDML